MKVPTEGRGDVGQVEEGGEDGRGCFLPAIGAGELEAGGGGIQSQKG